MDEEISLSVEKTVLFGSHHALLNRLELLRKLRPIVFIGSDYNIRPSCDANGRVPVAWISATLGTDPLFVINNTIDAVRAHMAQTPYAVVSTLKAATVVLTSDAAGEIAATPILAAAAAGIFHRIVEMSSVGYVTASLAAAFANITLSDIAAPNAILPIAPSATMKYGPFVQTTPATAINGSCAAGLSTALSTFIITLRYWDG